MEVFISDLKDFDTYRVLDKKWGITGKIKIKDKEYNIFKFSSSNIEFVSDVSSPPSVIQVSGIIQRELLKLRMVVKNMLNEAGPNSRFILFNMAQIYYRYMNNGKFRLDIILFGITILPEEIREIKLGACPRLKSLELAKIEGIIINSFHKLFNPNKNGVYRFDKIISLEDGL